MSVDVEVQTTIESPLQVVAAFAGDPANAPQWYANIRSVRWQTPPPVDVGSRMDFVAQFLGRRLASTYEVAELEPGRRLVMRTADGPFPMETTYTWKPVSETATPDDVAQPRSSLRPLATNRTHDGARHAARHTKDLERLKTLLEERAPIA